MFAAAANWDRLAYSLSTTQTQDEEEDDGSEDEKQSIDSAELLREELILMGTED